MDKIEGRRSGLGGVDIAQLHAVDWTQHALIVGSTILVHVQL